MCPDGKDVAYKPPPLSRFICLGQQELSFQIPFEKFAYDSAIQVPMAVPWICK